MTTPQRVAVDRQSEKAGVMETPSAGEQRATAVADFLNDEVRKKLLNFFRKKLVEGSPEMAEDLASETIVRFWYATVFKGEGNRYPTLNYLLFGIARNVWLEHSRELALTPMLQRLLDPVSPEDDTPLIETIPPPSGPEAEPVASPEDTLLDACVLDEQIAIACAGIHRLPKREYQILRLHLEGKSADEIVTALKLDITPKRVANICSELPKKIYALAMQYADLG